MQMSDEIFQRVQVRSYEPRDQATVARLYTDGLLAGQIAPNDTGADIENINIAYFDDKAAHFWIAELEGKVLGMIGVARDSEHLAEIRRLRVDKQFQQKPIGAKLLETALAHCHKHGHLKVVFDTRVDADSGPDAVVDLFERFGFQHTRTRPVAGKELLEFYLDIYRSPNPESESGAAPPSP